jgi:hypothetical protein
MECCSLRERKREWKCLAFEEKVRRPTLPRKSILKSRFLIVLAHSLDYVSGVSEVFLRIGKGWSPSVSLRFLDLAGAEQQVVQNASGGARISFVHGR